MEVSQNDWPMRDLVGGALRWAGVPRRLGEEPVAAGGDRLRSRTGRPGKGRRKETRAGRAAVRRWWLSRWWQRRKRQLRAVAAAPRAGCGSRSGWRCCSVRCCWALPRRTRVSIRPLVLEVESHRPLRPPPGVGPWGLKLEAPLLSDDS